MLPDPKAGCHKTGFTKKCKTLVVNGTCNRWMHLVGNHPQTGEKLDESRCVDDWVPLLLLENAQMSRQTGGAIESFRNEMVKSNAQSVVMLASMAAHKALPEM